MSAEKLSLQEAAERLGVHYMTAYRYVRTGRLPATQIDGLWQISAGDLETVRPGRASSGKKGAADLDTTRHRLCERLLAADGVGAWKVIEQHIHGGADAKSVHGDLLEPLLVNIGERWRSGELTVAEEHLVSAQVTRLLGRLSPTLARRGRRPRGTVVVGAVAGDQHHLPSHLFSNRLELAGPEVVLLGANTPVASFVDAVERFVANAVAVSVTAPGLDDAVRATTTAISEQCDGVLVFVGGSAVQSRAHALELGATTWFADTATAVDGIVKSLGARGAD